jgi:ATP phosphoribosyltransferase regulatory subunit
MDGNRDLLPTGLEDRLAPRARQLAGAVAAALDRFDMHGYQQVQPSPIEFEHVLASRMAGVETRRMVRFVDPESLRTLALRSDMTVQIGRIASSSMLDAPRPLRLCYAGEVATIRAAPPETRRQRMQIGAELIGSDSARAASEAVCLAIDALQAAGVGGLTLDLTLPDCVDTLAKGPLPLAPERVEAVRRELDMKDAGGLKAAGGEAYLPLLYATGPIEAAIEALSAIDAGGALASRIDGLRKVAQAVPRDVAVTLDPGERHGFEYQSWFGFTLYASAARRAVGRGGTYTILGSDEPATGFSLFGDVLVDTLPEADGEGRLTLFLPIDHDRAIATALRAEGWRTIAAITGHENARALGCSHLLRDSAPVPV